MPNVFPDIMNTIHTIEDMRHWSGTQQAAGRSIALVPTMGFLHEGHLSLIDRARREADLVVVSLFVNPTQFGPREDFETYPQDVERDEALCRERGVAALFMPEAGEMYAPDHSTWVDEETLSSVLCGASRPGHFRGVCTVVTKLLLAVQPDCAVFGWKDAQQFLVLRRMTRDLNLPVRLLAEPIVREPDGLAMSSRNVRLSPEHRRQAVCLHRALNTARDDYQQGERSADALLAHMREVVNRAPDAEIDYVELVGLDTLRPVDTVDHPCLAALAVRFGDVRLIDNMRLPPDDREPRHDDDA